MMTLQAPRPEQPLPLHPANDEPPATDAFNVTLVFPIKLAEQVLPQLMAGGLLVTVPVPEPFRLTVSAKVATPLVVTATVFEFPLVPLALLARTR